MLSPKQKRKQLGIYINNALFTWERRQFVLQVWMYFPCFLTCWLRTIQRWLCFQSIHSVFGLFNMQVYCTGHRNSGMWEGMKENITLLWSRRYKGEQSRNGREQNWDSANDLFKCGIKICQVQKVTAEFVRWEKTMFRK